MLVGDTTLGFSPRQRQDEPQQPSWAGQAQPAARATSVPVAPGAHVPWGRSPWPLSRWRPMAGAADPHAARPPEPGPWGQGFRGTVLRPQGPRASLRHPDEDRSPALDAPQPRCNGEGRPRPRGRAGCFHIGRGLCPEKACPLPSPAWPSPPPAFPGMSLSPGGAGGGSAGSQAEGPPGWEGRLGARAPGPAPHLPHGETPRSSSVGSVHLSLRRGLKTLLTRGMWSGGQAIRPG